MERGTEEGLLSLFTPIALVHEPEHVDEYVDEYVDVDEYKHEEEDVHAHAHDYAPAFVLCSS